MMRVVALLCCGLLSLATHEPPQEHLSLATAHDDLDPELVPVEDEGMDDSDIVDRKVDQFMNPSANPEDMVKAVYDFNDCAATCARLLSMLGGSGSPGDEKNSCVAKCEKCAAANPPEDLDREKKNTVPTQAYRRECMTKEDDNDDESS